MPPLPSRLALVLLLAASAVSAQTPDTRPDEAGLEAHALPFASGGHTLELALAPAAGAGGGQAAGPLTVAVASAPAWLTFDQTQAEATVDAQPDGTGGEPVARLGFAVAREAPVGVPADIRLTVRDASGATVGEKTVRVAVSAPAELSVDPPRPNPSRGSALVPYAVPAPGRVRVSLFDLLGREVAVLADSEHAAGGHSARVPSGRLASGVYVVRITAAGSGGAGSEARQARLTVVR